MGRPSVTSGGIVAQARFPTTSLQYILCPPCIYLKVQNDLLSHIPVIASHLPDLSDYFTFLKKVKKSSPNLVHLQYLM